ncbi:hypothetical protein ALC57_08338 [Trachymyrmex cornetzi]|uniref:THAP domain-containing protein 9 n=1 Tax=Trachymyrmex cornetzi TaxID=471704 RepID=A0A151J770_9HYME|nr:hypothetical protein ALC57_08338 [Trachymyrmex cornetzi]
MTNSPIENSSVNRPTTPSNSGHIELFQTPKKAVHVPRYVGDIRSPQLSTPKKAKRALNVAKRTIQRLRKKIKMLQQDQRRLIARITTMEGLIKHLKNKSLLSEVTAENLMVPLHHVPT